jgi:hypothetical protein
MELLNFIANDGSRHFWSIPETYPFTILSEHLSAIPGCAINRFLSDNVVEAWIDFRFMGYVFTVNNQFGEWWFFANDPECPDATLQLLAGCITPRDPSGGIQRCQEPNRCYDKKNEGLLLTRRFAN